MLFFLLLFGFCKCDEILTRYVNFNGSDSEDCSARFPCLTISHAFSVVDPLPDLTAINVFIVENVSLDVVASLSHQYRFLIGGYGETQRKLMVENSNSYLKIEVEFLLLNVWFVLPPIIGLLANIVIYSQFAILL
jgi:hypothetical protein